MSDFILETIRQIRATAPNIVAVGIIVYALHWFFSWV